MRAVRALPGTNASGHPDGRTLLATTGDDGAVRIWDPTAGQQTRDPLTGHTGALVAVCTLPGTNASGHPDGRTLLATGGGDGTVRVWDPTTGQQTRDPLTGGVYAVCTLPGTNTNGRPESRTLLATTGGDGTVRVWDPATGQQTRDPLVGHTGPVRAVCTLPGTDAAGHPDGRTLLATAGGLDDIIRVWDPATGQQTRDALVGHTGGVGAVCTLPGSHASGHPDGRTLLATAGGDGTVRVWDLVTGQQVRDPLIGHTGPVWAVCTLPGSAASDHLRLATGGGDETVRVWDLVTGQQERDALIGHTGPVWAVCTLPGTNTTGHPDGRTLLATTGDDGTIRMWDPTTGRQTRDPLTSHTGPVWAMCTLPGTNATGHPDGRTLLATAGGDGTVRVWDPTAGTAVGAPLAALSTAVEALAPLHAPDATGCLALTADGTTHVWTPATAAWSPAPAAHHTTAVATTNIAGRQYVLSGDATGHLHRTDLAAGSTEPSPPTRADDGALLALQALPPASAVAVAGRTGTITIHPRTDDGAAIRRLTGHTAPVRTLCLVDLPDHRTLLASAGNDATIRLWDLDTGDQVGAPLTGHNGWIWDLEALPGAHPRLASAGADTTVRLWDPLTGQQVGQPLAGHTDQVRALAVATTPDGHTLLVSGSHDGTVRLWHPTTGQSIHTIPLGIPVHALLYQRPDPDSLRRTDNGATLTVGLRTGILSLDLNRALFPTASGSGP
jgi:WD40 repeat protein